MSEQVGAERLVVGFDLDMTLADPRLGVQATFASVSEEIGVAIDGALVASRLGPSLEIELARWVPAEQVAAVADVYRKHFATLGVDGTSVMPGAEESLAAVRQAGGTALVVTAKSKPLAQATLDRLGLVADETLGWRWGDGKGEVLAERGAAIYVGDHTGDMMAARTCGAIAVAVMTGADSEQALRDAGAHVVLASLVEFPEWLSSYLLTKRLTRLEERLQELGSVLVAFSGGADSALVLAAAVRALGPDRVVAATAISPSLPTSELEEAKTFAASLGVRHLTPSTDELSRDGYRANAGDRCFFCKAELLDVLSPVAAEHGLAYVVTGTNADDVLAGFRPGIRAAAERGAATPLLDAGLTKAQVREASRQWGLETWDKPAAACLSSRIAYGVEVTASRLWRVERAETALRVAMAGAGLAPRDLRVRDLGDRARVEVDAALVDSLAARPDLLAVVEGFEAVEVEPRGFRSGAMNDLLVDADRWR
ncbi:MAG TPA: ATP-dependent sacrificial sulfur transferase LarE [Mycobacteriales bacterium]|nr:ATP-dependent sacrificial sulfur transferase LarE [Mycobacteriales bacterium]